MRQFVAQRRPKDIFHYEEVHALLRVKVMNCRDVGVVQLRQGESFFTEAPAGRFVGQGAGWQNLDCHFAIEMIIVGTINFAHTADADLLDDTVVTQDLTNQRILTGGGVRHGERCSFLPTS